MENDNEYFFDVDVQEQDDELPSTSTRRKATKEPVAVPISWLDYYPCWRITHLEMCPPYGWHEIDPATLVYIQSKLRSFESMTLSQIFIRAKKQNHGVMVYKLCPQAQKRLRALGHDATI